jgi:golgi SNAP receptor complex member 2
LDSYSTLSRQEPNTEKAAKATERLKNFRSDLTSYRGQFDALKRDREDAVTVNNRNELLGRRPHHGGSMTPENPYAQPSSSLGGGQNPLFAGRGQDGAGAGGGLSFGSNDTTRESHALREQSFFAQTNSQLDEFLDRGRAVLGDLGQQREMLKGTQRKLYSVANTLGISGDTIRMVERRAKQDKWIFWGGVVVFVGFCWLVIHFLRWSGLGRRRGAKTHTSKEIWRREIHIDFIASGWEAAWRWWSWSRYACSKWKC